MSNVQYYLFNGSCYARIDSGTSSADSEKSTQRSIESDWCKQSGIPDFFKDDLDDIFHCYECLYILKGDKFARLKIASDSTVDESPLSLSELFPGAKGTKFTADIDAAVGINNNEVYLFKGTEYIRYNFSNDSMVTKPTSIATAWPGLQALGFDNDLDAACRTADNKNIYFFKGDDYIIYDPNASKVIQQPKKIADAWCGIKRVQAVCSLGHDGMCCCDPSVPGYKPQNPTDNNHCDCNNNGCGNNGKYDPYSNGPGNDGQPDNTGGYVPGSGVLPNGNDPENTGIGHGVEPKGDGDCDNCGGRCGQKNEGGQQCFMLPANTDFGLNALINSAAQQTIKVYVDDKQVDTLTGNGVGNVNAGSKIYHTVTGKVCLEVSANGKLSKIRFADNPLQGKPGFIVLGAEDGTDDDYNDTIVLLNWGLQ